MPTKENPADFTTRGMRVSDVAKERKWWSGPDFLRKEESDWPKNQIDTEKVSEATEIKKATPQTGRNNEDWTTTSLHVNTGWMKSIKDSLTGTIQENSLTPRSCNYTNV